MNDSAFAWEVPVPRWYWRWKWVSIVDDAIIQVVPIKRLLITIQLAIYLCVDAMIPILKRAGKYFSLMKNAIFLYKFNSIDLPAFAQSTSSSIIHWTLEHQKNLHLLKIIIVNGGFLFCYLFSFYDISFSRCTFTFEKKSFFFLTRKSRWSILFWK